MPRIPRTRGRTTRREREALGWRFDQWEAKTGEFLHPASRRKLSWRRVDADRAGAQPGKTGRKVGRPAAKLDNIKARYGTEGRPKGGLGDAEHPPPDLFALPGPLRGGVRIVGVLPRPGGHVAGDRVRILRCRTHHGLQSGDGTSTAAIVYVVAYAAFAIATRSATSALDLFFVTASVVVACGATYALEVGQRRVFAQRGLRHTASAPIRARSLPC